MDGGRRQSAGLPSINFLELDKMKREEVESQQRFSVGVTAANVQAAALVSPTFPYTGPPPPYSQAAPASNSVPAGLSGLISPPGSRRTSGDDEKDRPPPLKQSLPSIHEALGADPPRSYPYPSPAPTAAAAAATSAPPAATSQPYPPTSYPSTSDLTNRSQETSMPAPPPPHPYTQITHSSPLSTNNSTAAPHRPPSTHPETDSYPRPTYPGTQNPKLPTLHPLTTTQSPVFANRPLPSYSYSQAQPVPAPHYEPAPHSAGAVNPPFGYSQASQQYPHPASMPGTSTPGYHPTGPLAAPQYPPIWKSDAAETTKVEESKRTGRVPGQGYGESVKRHLDLFDLEASLNEIAEGSGQLLDFTRHYGRLAHQTRSGPLPGTMPNIGEIDDLMKQGARIQESLGRIRDVILAQHAAMAERAQDTRSKAPPSYSQEDSASYQEESRSTNGGFAGGDPKKRRGRAAPPGRCHSCNRAETPEWRRGPDGARTLCNACGLHYAKLTRKMGQNGKTPAGPSNLRPKSMGPGSSPA